VTRPCILAAHTFLTHIAMYVTRVRTCHLKWSDVHNNPRNCAYSATINADKLIVPPLMRLHDGTGCCTNSHPEATVAYFIIATTFARERMLELRSITLFHSLQCTFALQFPRRPWHLQYPRYLRIRSCVDENLHKIWDCNAAYSNRDVSVQSRAQEQRTANTRTGLRTANRRTEE
jgi:hypothetical protein